MVSDFKNGAKDEDEIEDAGGVLKITLIRVTY
jgi:hypothetical protein